MAREGDRRQLEITVGTGFIFSVSMHV